MHSLNFTCPNCGRHTIEEIMANVTVASEIIGISGDDGHHLEFDYGEQTNEGGEVCRYQCANCGLLIADDASTIREALEQGGWLLDPKNDECPVDSDGDAETNMEGRLLDREKQGKSLFSIQQEFDDEPVYIVDDEDREIVTIEANPRLTATQRSKLAKIIKDELIGMRTSK